MRAAVATAAAEAAEEEGSRAATSHGYNGKHAWQQKEAAAHALYSRRLQVLPLSARVIRQHTSAYVVIRQHTAAHALYSRRLQVLPVSARGPDSSFVTVLQARVLYISRQQTSLYVSAYY
jgi:hypothetical protein